MLSIILKKLSELLSNRAFCSFAQAGYLSYLVHNNSINDVMALATYYYLQDLSASILALDSLCAVKLSTNPTDTRIWECV